MPEPFVLGETKIAPGSRVSIELPVSRGYTATPVCVPVHVVHGRRDGARLLVCAAVHGDEITGVEIVRRLLASRQLTRLRGTLIAVPVVNVYGFVARSRYLPDRRDLNRSFPGSSRGSQAARLAHTVMSELVTHATHVVDLHSGALHRENLPQIRGCLDDPRTVELARAFEVPVVLHAELRDGSLRAALSERDIPAVVYEAGEALRFDEVAIRAGLRGVLGVMRWLQMLPPLRPQKPARSPLLARGSHWVRAPESGILRTDVKLGSKVEKGAVIGIVSDPLGEGEQPVITPHSGVVIGRTNLPLVNEGDALFHVALFQEPEMAANHVEAFHESLDPDSDDGADDLDPDH